MDGPAGPFAAEVGPAAILVELSGNLALRIPSLDKEPNDRPNCQTVFLETSFI